MPYILPNRRLHLNPALAEVHREILTPGELNYAITELIYHYASTNRTYQGINDCLGALEGAKLEFYRRFAAPYEDTKIKLNGDVY